MSYRYNKLVIWDFRYVYNVTFNNQLRKETQVQISIFTKIEKNFFKNSIEWYYIILKNFFSYTSFFKSFLEIWKTT